MRRICKSLFSLGIAAVAVCSLSGCFFTFLMDPQWKAARGNSNKYRAGRKYWRIKNETLVPLEEEKILSGLLVTYSRDGRTRKTVKIHDYGRGIGWYKESNPEEVEKIEERYEALLKGWRRAKEDRARSEDASLEWHGGWRAGYHSGYGPVDSGKSDGL